jgi:hypothetical protein
MHDQKEIFMLGGACDTSATLDLAASERGWRREGEGEWGGGVDGDFLL